MEKRHLQARINPRAANMLDMMAISSGLNAGRLIEAGIYSLMLALAKQGKIGGEIKSKLLSMEQAGLLDHQKLIELLEDSDGPLRQKPIAPVVKRPRGRPRKAKPIDPIAAQIKAAA